MKGLPVRWWIAGGWAIDLFVGRQTRPHGDCDVLVLRRDQLAAQEHLTGWDLYASDPRGTLRPWLDCEFLPVGVHDIWCRRGSNEPWAFQLMLAEDLGDEWVFRRDPRIRGMISELGGVNAQGIPYLLPQIQLLYKARPQPLEKDETDFTIVLPLLSEEARAWLLSALIQLYHRGHQWIDRLRDRS